MCINKLSRLFLSCLTSCLGLMLCTPLAPLNAQVKNSNVLLNPLTYTTQNTGSNGLINNKIYSIYEDKAGALWFGTDAKVGKYYQGAWNIFLEDDGWDQYKGFWEKDSADVYFINYHGILHYSNNRAKHLYRSNTPNLLQYIHTSYVDGEGTLWLAGTDNDAQAYQIINNKGDGWQERNRLEMQALDLNPSHLVYSMFIDVSGRTWLSTYHDLLYYDGSTWRKMFNRYSGMAKYNFAEDEQGRLLLMNENGVFSYEGGEFSILAHTGGTSNLEKDLEGNWWFGDQQGNLHKWNGQTISTVTLPSPLTTDQTNETNTIHAVRQISDGSLYVGTTFGLWHITNLQDVMQDARQINTFDGLPSNNITSILQDNKGLYWYGTTDGLSTFDGQQWQYISHSLKPHKIAQNGDVWCSKGSSNDFYLGYNTLSVFNGQDWRDFDTYETGISEVTSIAQGPDSRIFVAGFSGIAVWDGLSWQKVFHDSRLKIYNLFADSKGSLWFSYQHENPWDSENYGVGYYKDNQVHFFGDGEVIAYKLINKIMEDRQGQIWFATYNDGVISFNGNNWHVHNMGTANLRDNFISTVVEDDAGGIWVVYPFYLSLGASRYDGTSWTHYTTSNGLPTNKIKDLYMAPGHAVEEGSAGGRILASTTSKIWIGSQVGLTVMELNFQKKVLGVAEVELEDDVQLYPNPTNGHITVRFKTEASDRTLQLLDLQGRIKMQKLIANEQESQLSLATLPNGLYLLRISDGRSTATYKVVKQ